MRNIFWLLVIILIIGWAIGFFAFGQLLGAAIHILLVVAVIMILVRVIQGPRTRI
ncbi:lmo0937 family membrane protein [Flavobacterium sp. JP2137]|uniref:lmo0937 family membrane protein n=1 Tax=Flavobacterium sp. JP2137 TaxID=3414510 RepID=UPI003D2FC7BC